MQSNHFLLDLVGTYHELCSAAGVSNSEFAAGARHHFFNSNEPITSPTNFAAACEIILEARLPRQRSLASVHVSASFDNDRSVRLRAGATSSHAGREYLERLTRDTALALELFDLVSKTAQSFNIAIDDI